MDFHSLTRKDLQTLCKKNGIPANITNVAMADALKALHTTVQGIEELSNGSQSLTAQSGVESPERSELTSPRVPRTRSIRKKVENVTLVNQTQSRICRSSRNLNSGYAADQKDTIAPINIDVQFSEVQKQSNISMSKEAGIPQTPSMVSNTRKRGSKGETTATKTYGTRRSTRLAAKTLEDTSDAANMQLFSANCGDNYEMSVKECYTDLSEDVQSTVSHSEVVSETSKCEEMTSNNTGVEIPNDLGSGCDSTKDCEKIIEMAITEVTDEENKGDDFLEQPEIENNDEVIGENGDDLYEEPEIEMKDEVTAENGDGITKQPDTEIIAEVAAETQDLNGENDKLNGNGEVVTGDGVCGVVINDVIDGKGDVNLVPEMNGMVSADNGDILAETKDYDGENLVPDMNGLALGDNGVETEGDLTFGDNGDMIVETKGDLTLGDNCDMIVETEGGHAAGDSVVAVEEFLSESEEEKEELVSESEEEKEEFVTIAAEEQLDKGGDCDKPSQENSGEEDASKAQSDAQMIFVDDGIGIVLPATAPPAPTPGKKKSAASTKMMDNPNVLLGKENGDEYICVAKEENQQNNECNPASLSMRQLKKQLKKLSIGSNNKKGNSVKEDDLTTPRAALQTLPENQF